MTLSGNLEYFPIEEVLRLLARSQQTGCLEVMADGRGRIYVDGGSISYVATPPDDALERALVSAGLATGERVSQLDASGGSLNAAVEDQDRYAAMVREYCVEGLYRVQTMGGVPFEFQVGTRPRPATGLRFDVEALIDEARRRAAAWADIHTAVPDLAVPWRMVPTLEEDSVTIGDTAWRVLAALEGGCSVDGLAERIGVTRFQAAQRMAELSRARLVEALTGAAPEAAPNEPVVEEIAATSVPAWEEPVSVEPAPAEEPESTPATEEAAFVDRSWWEEPTEQQPAAAPKEPAAADEFLETVFSELDKTEEDQGSEEEETGFGLLRRRGLGSAFRELADS